MAWPFTSDYLTSLIAANTCAALMLTALLVFWRLRSISRGALVVAVWLAALSVMIGPTMEALVHAPGPHVLRNVLAASAMLATMGALVEGRPFVALVALLGQAPLWFVTGFVKDSSGELSALHLAWVGLIVGLTCRRSATATLETSRPAPEGSYLVHDVAVFVAGTLLAALVCVFVLDRREGSADEWAYTFQAAVFAKGHPFASALRCQKYLEQTWVFEDSGKLFSQYPPGWPLFMAPLVWLHAVWLAGPLSTGLMACGMGRLARSAARCFGRNDEPPSARTIAIAGTWAAGLSMFATTILLNGASRFPHVWTVALYAWSLEGLMQIATPGLSDDDQVRWGAVLGGSAVLSVATRPADGAFVGIGLAVLFVYWLARRNVRWRAMAAAAMTSVAISSVVLCILRMQLGKWFQTGYALQPAIHPAFGVKYSMPTPLEWKYGVPLAVGSYCWWPCSMPVGLAGLAMLRGRAKGLATAIALGLLPFMAFLEFLEFNRAGQFEYGPRYLTVLLVPMAVGSALALAPLTTAALERVTAGRTAFARGAPLGLAVFAAVSGWLRVVPLEWPSAIEHTRRHSAVERAIEDARLDKAIVVIPDHTTGFWNLDLTTNYPLDLYPDQSVIKAVDKGDLDAAVSCLGRAFPGRRVYVASGYSDVKLEQIR